MYLWSVKGSNLTRKFFLDSSLPAFAFAFFVFGFASLSFFTLSHLRLRLRLRLWSRLAFVLRLVSPSPSSPVSPRFRSSSRLASAFVFTFALPTFFVCFAGAQPSKGELLSRCGSQSSQVDLCDSRRSRRQPLKDCSHPPFFLVSSSFVLEFYLVLAIENENPSTKPRSLTNLITLRAFAFTIAEKKNLE